ncbi:MAG: DUF1385 domain-containing protein [Synergistaceae bacterium]|jgi:uncharacterized protein YqhQ|nr:DUF1385 domain-containing protein [Synergistaceae bacterium]
MNRIFGLPAIFINLVRSLMEQGDGEPGRDIPVGGQAVIEGVLMKGPRHWGLVVRKPDGSLWSGAWLESKWLKKGAWKWPVIRGFASMAEMMRIGFRALSISAEQALGEEENFTAAEMAFTVLFAVLMVGGLFVALPLWLSDLTASRFGYGGAAKNVLEGAARGLVFISYIAAVGLWKDVKRVFSYHGAEHKTINAYENGVPLDTESVAACSRIHRRCGTSFIIVAVVTSIFVFSFFGRGPIWERILARIVLLPLVIGISYEVIKSAAKSGSWGKYLVMPALSLQYLTTREPDRSMLEVAIKSLEVALDPNPVLNAVKEEKIKKDGILEQA